MLSLTPPADELILSLADPAAVGDPAVFGKGRVLDVVALNPTDVDLTLGDEREVRSELKLLPGCPKGSFAVSGQRRTTTQVPAHNVLPVVVGSFRLRYVDKPGEDQSACVGADINFEWEGSHA